MNFLSYFIMSKTCKIKVNPGISAAISKYNETATTKINYYYKQVLFTVYRNINLKTMKLKFNIEKQKLLPVFQSDLSDRHDEKQCLKLH